MEYNNDSSDKPTRRRSKKIDLSEKPPLRRSKRIKSIGEGETLIGGGEILNLPRDIIEDILLRLPVKSLSKLKCVSKSWYSFISSPGFVKSHLRYSISDPKLSNHMIMFNKSRKLKSCYVSSVFHEPATDAVGMSYPEKHPRRDYFVVGSCHGLICVASYGKEIFLWNPTLRMSRKLPPVGKKPIGLLSPAYGFGYDASHDDYKVVNLSSSSGDHDVRERMAHVYSLKTDSWKRIEDFKGVPSSSRGAYANGKLHFAATISSGNNSDVQLRNIITLDLENEAYEKVEYPISGYCKYWSSLGVLNGCISISCTIDEHVPADVWVLKEYGVKDCWTKVVSIPYVGPYLEYYSNPLCMLSDGKVLFLHQEKLVIYNPEDNSFRCPQINNCGLIFRAYTCVESLVPVRLQKLRRRKM